MFATKQTHGRRVADVVVLAAQRLPRDSHTPLETNCVS